MYYLQQLNSLTTKLPHSKLKYGSFSRVTIVVMFDQLKIARIHARNVPRVHGHTRLDDDASIASLTPGKRRCGVLDAPGRRFVETQKIVSGQLGLV